MPPPVKMVPNASPTTQMTAASTMARTSVALATGGGRKTPSAMTMSATASTTEAASPLCPTSEAACLSSAASQPGSPLAMPATMSCTAVGARLAGVSAK